MIAGKPATYVSHAVASLAYQHESCLINKEGVNPHVQIFSITNTKRHAIWV